MSSSPLTFSFFSLLTEGPKNAALQRSSQVTARTLLRGVNKVNKTQPAKSWPHRLPPASPQRLPRSLNPVSAASKTKQRAKLHNPTNHLVMWLTTNYSHRTWSDLFTAHLLFVLFSSQQIHPRKPQIVWIRSSERTTDCWDPALPSRLFLLLQTELFIAPTSSRRELLHFQQQMQAGGGRWENVEEKWMETRINVGRNPGGLWELRQFERLSALGERKFTSLFYILRSVRRCVIFTAVAAARW